MTYLDIKHKWLDTKDAAADELAATLAHLQIFIGKSNITQHKPPAAGAHDLQIPVYYLAEWIAENWWVLLFEPRKHEQDDDPDFITRHSLVAAQHGFPLPALSIIPFGRSIGLSCVPRRAPFANVQFTVDAFGDAPRNEVQDALAVFVADTVSRLETRGLDAGLVHTWRELQSLTEDEKQFCELVGSLGVAPADASDELASAIEKIYDGFGERATRDFCLAATSTQVFASAGLAEDVTGALNSGTSLELSPLLSARLPKENFYAPSWRRGLQAAKNVREKLNISSKDPNGADRLFEKLQIDTSNAVHIRNTNSPPPLAGAIDRRDSAAQIVLLQDQELQRRFTASRAAYLAWVSEDRSRRLVTNAVTRDQQASRQFAAEILIPRGYLEGLSGSKRELRREQIYEAARQRRVMPDVAFWQASNAGIRVSAI